MKEFYKEARVFIVNLPWDYEVLVECEPYLEPGKQEGMMLHLWLRKRNYGVLEHMYGVIAPVDIEGTKEIEEYIRIEFGGSFPDYIERYQEKYVFE